MDRYLKAFLAVIIFLLTQMIVSAIFLLVMFLSCYNEGGTDNECLELCETAEQMSVALLLLISGAITVVALYCMKMIDLTTLKKVRNLTVKDCVLAVAGALSVIVFSNYVNEQLDLPDLLEESFLMLSRGWFSFVVVGVVGPIVEETVFRESILGELMRRGVGKWKAILISALSFGLVHINPAQVPFAFALGLVFGLIYVKTGNIVLTTLIHIINNCVSLYTIRIYGDDASQYQMSDFFGTPAVSALVFTAVGLIGVYLLWLFYKSEIVKD